MRKPGCFWFSALRGGLLAGLVIALATSGPAPACGKDVPVNDETVAAAIRKAAEYLWSQQNEEGHWDETNKQLKKKLAERIETVRARYRGEGAAKVKSAVEYTRKSFYSTINRNRSGQSALALLGLIHAGVKPANPRFVKALKWMAEVHPTGTYALGLRCALWSALDDKRFHKLLRDEALMLQNGIWRHGTYSYVMRPEDNLADTPQGDFSNTQYGVLGVWAGSEGDVEIHPKYWKLVEHGYLWGQQRDGGWRYPVIPEHKAGATDSYPGSRAALTLGGIASLFVIWDRFYARGGCDAKINPELVRALERGIKWVGKHYAARKKQNRLWFHPYELYALERAGVATGLKYFGDVDWYKSAAAYALRSQSQAGAWSGNGTICGTGWAVMFLSYGSAPVLFNKLAYGRTADWNLRPRDLANLTRWMGKKFESKFNWQIISIDSQAADLQDAPILFISGKRGLKFTPEQKARLRNYVVGGGTILASPAGNATAFTRSMQALLLELFPGRELVPVPADDPVYTTYVKFAPPPHLLGLSNGYRWLALIGTSDLGCPWQQLQVVRQRNWFNLARNLYVYVSDGGQLKGRGQSYLLADAGNRPTRTLNVGRLTWGSAAQSDPEPAAWLNQDIRMRNAGLMSLTVQPTDLAQPLDPQAAPLLHVTGVTAVTLTDQAKANLKRYVEGGGLLLADAAGGGKAFTESFRKLAEELFGPNSLVPAPAGLPFIDQATDNGKTWFRHRFNLPRAQRPMEVLAVQSRSGRLGVVFLPYDLSAAMVGYSSQAPAGLTPKSADRFVTALLKWRAGPPAAGQPAPQQP